MVGPHGGELVERIPSVEGGLGLEAPAPQQLLQAHALCRVVLDDEDAVRLGPACPLCHSSLSQSWMIVCQL